MNELEALAERAEKAEGADRELDCDIGVALGLFRAIAAPEGSARGTLFARVEPFGLSAPGNGSGDSLVPGYTASIDAAVTLIPRTWKLRQANFSAPCADDRKWHLNLHGGPEGRDAFVGRGATQALALCAAALKARALAPAMPV